MGDPGAEHGETFAHERGEARPTLGRDEIAVDMGLRRGDVDINAADGGDLWLAVFQRRDAPAGQNALDRHQQLRPVADRKDGFAGFVKVSDEPLHVLVDADVFRPSPARDLDRVIGLRLNPRECRVEGVEMPGLFRIGLIALEIMQRSLDLVARLFAGTDDVHDMADGGHGLILPAVVNR
jgi:hypothetical protein